MRPRRLFAAAVCAATVAASTVLTTGTANAAVNYVALGDSYASGLGAGSYESGSGSCYRSSRAFSRLWANANSPTSFNFAACSGATTASVRSGQLGALSSSTTLVSISVGGNDAGFTDVVVTCILGSDADCVNRVNTAKSFAANTLPGRLNSLFADMKSRAPSAHVVALGYPRLYTGSTSCLELSTAKRSALNGGADALDSTIAKAAANAGFDFGDVRPTFSGHERCSSSPWLNGVTLPINESFHPNASGQSQGYLPVFSALAS